MAAFNSTFEYKLIYVFRINDLEHKDLLKIGEATCNTNKTATELFPNCKELNTAAKNRINQYTTTAGISYELIYTEIAVYNTIKNGVTQIKAFSDHDVHKVLERSGIKRHYFDTLNKANEWFKVDLETAKKAIQAVKEGRTSLTSSEVTKDNNPIIFRPEQKKAIKETISQFKKSDNMLWNAKMRFGKTLTALQVAKEMGFKRTLILTHRPVVSDGWYEDFGKIFYDTDYVFGSKTKGEKIENLVGTSKNFVYFASMQDLRGAEVVGGKFDKNEDIFLTEWNFIVIDEAHEGTLTKLGQTVIDTLTKISKKPKILRLSGTPFNLLEQFKSDEIYTWDYVMEQYAKKHWDDEHPGDPNPYATLPELKIFTYNLNSLIEGYTDIEDNAFNFREFFRTWTGSVEKDFTAIPNGAKVGDFVHENDVLRFINLLCKTDNESNYPFSTEEYRSYFRHSLWMVPGVNAAMALKALLLKHSVFGSGAFKIVNVAGNNDEEINPNDALNEVRKAFGDNPDETYTITISCGRLTTGVSVPEWTAVFMLAGSSSTQATSYMQTIFRVQTPANINGKIKERCYVFDFAPDRTLKMVAEAGKLSTKAGDTTTDRVAMGKFLNFCPVIAIDGSNMLPYNVDMLLQKLKTAYTDRVVKNGFDDIHIYNDKLLKLNDIELKDFEKLKSIIGSTKQTKKAQDVDVNNQGFTNEQYEQLQQIKKKPKKELTEEDKKRLAELEEKQKNKQKAISILRGISIRIPLIIYGANVSFEEEITCENFTSLVDDASWEEFMPNGVTKEIFNNFAKYYDEDIFISAGRNIRNSAKSADSLAPVERIEKLVEIFAKFKNPDKETVLTPWRVVNMHLGDCLGGYNFYNTDYTDTLSIPRYIDKGKVTTDTLANVNAKILEINSKTGLYPLYVTYSIYRKRIEQINPNLLTFEKQLELWDLTVKENLYVICKTPMARAITQRTLLGYRNGKINAHSFDDLIMQLKEKPEQFKEKILRGSFWKKEVKEMKFDAVVGNPPYQGNNHQQIYPHFYLIARQTSNNYVSLIFPTGWQEPKNANNLSKLNNPEVKADKQIIFIDNRQNVFPGISGAEWTNIILWKKNFDNGYDGEQLVYTNGKEPERKFLSWEATAVQKPKEIIDLLQCVRNSCSYISLQKSTSVLKPYGLRTDVFRNFEKYKLAPLSEVKVSDTDITVIGLKQVRYIPRDYALPKRTVCIDKYKVFVPYAWGNMSESAGLGGAFADIMIAAPYEICTETYLESGCFDDLDTAKKHAKYLMTKFARAMLYVNKNSQHSTTAWGDVPTQDYTETWWDKSIAEIDKELVKKYNIPSDIAEFIDKNIQTKDESNIINFN